MSQVEGGSFHHGITYGYEWYQVLGGMQDWADFFRQSVHATLEISNTKWPSASDLPAFWNDNRESLYGYLEGGLTGIHLRVTDVSGALLPVDVDTDTATRTLHFDGIVHRPTIPGPQTVTLKAAGYASQTLHLQAVSFQGQYQTVVMH